MSGGGSILICPYFEVAGPERVRKIRDPLHCRFTETMREAGFEILERLPLLHLNPEFPEYPLTFGKLSRATDPARAAT